MKLLSTRKKLVAASIAGAAALLLGASGSHVANDPYLRPATVPAPADNQTTPERVELGKALFFDPRLSGSNWISCATCHNPALGWSDGLATGIGHGMKQLGRATPTIINTAFNPIQMWDGRKSTLEDQALGPIGADVEMNQPLPELIAKLEQIDGYRTLFRKAYPNEPISEKTLAKAIASFERTVISTESPFDRWRMGDQSAVDAPVKRGFEVFTGKGNCVACHQGFNFTDNGFHNIGVKDVGAVDLGRYNEKKLPSMKGAFKTPTLRDIALTAPYMRNGIYRTLDEVVEHYDRGGDVKENLSGNMKPLNLTAQEKADLVAFMNSLTGRHMAVAVPRLPQ
jgi:cytochrome c peroxidase